MLLGQVVLVHEDRRKAEELHRALGTRGCPIVARSIKEILESATSIPLIDASRLRIFIAPPFTKAGPTFFRLPQHYRCALRSRYLWTPNTFEEGREIQEALLIHKLEIPPEIYQVEVCRNQTKLVEKVTAFLDTYQFAV